MQTKDVITVTLCTIHKKYNTDSLFTIVEKGLKTDPGCALWHVQARMSAAACVTSICGKRHDEQLNALLILFKDSLQGQHVHLLLVLIYFEKI